ncbi:sugar ABC transporter substrate-binding protein [Vibrio sp. SS-MA-C1-2]|uniref:sugar ABC transporter substrate-binding protein n=1 Tax=Vibrio sp. SS-MA-C1-2 TaxID=2908646 RepID=UPI001F309947|nr:sugar ABC transporter substrate-binding protein [Vibrio sp. SS-MA-C1-2]UJF18490.1 sugar ABC transporter substrate-binding protein [Vibrio sp. SS-MA-C1-2]
MKLRTKVISLSLLAMATSFNAFSQETISLMISNRSNEFFGVLEQSAVDKAEELGYEIRVYDAANNASRQPNQVEDAIASGTDAIIINPLNLDASTYVLNEAISRNIPVITVDTTVDGVDLLNEIATDNEDGGKFAAEWLVNNSELNPSELGGIIHMKGLDGHTAHISRYKGFNDYLKSESVSKNWNQLANNSDKYIELTGSFSQDEAQTALEAKLSALDTTKKYVVYNENDVMAIGSIAAIENDTRFDLKNFTIIGFDGSSEGKSLVDEGKMAVTVVQDFNFIGSESVRVVDSFLKTGKSPSDTLTAVEVKMYPEDQSPR